MAALGVVPFSAMQAHGKIQVLQQSATANSNNERRGEIIILRRKPTIVAKPPTPNTPVNNNTSNNNKNTVNSGGRVKRKPVTVYRSITDGTGDVNGNGAGVVVASRTPQPPPVAVARRNARERNRVKQVNNGFATLRQHIPASVASAYTSSEAAAAGSGGSSGGRGSSKKLSKVETLRMAVDYIRSLQQMLSSDGDADADMHDNNASPISPSLPTSSPSYNQNYISYEEDTEHEASVIMEDDNSSCIGNVSPSSPSVTPVQYRSVNLIQMANVHDDGQKRYSYEYEVDENLAPLLVNSGGSFGRLALSLASGPPGGRGPSGEYLHEDVYQPQSSPMQTRPHPSASLSPGVYSEQSLSPCELVVSNAPTKLRYLPPFTVTTKLPSMNGVGSIESVIHPTYHTMQQLTVKKEEMDGDVTAASGGGVEDSDEDVMEMMTWWEHEQRYRETQQ